MILMPWVMTMTDETLFVYLWQEYVLLEYRNKLLLIDFHHLYLHHEQSICITIVINNSNDEQTSCRCHQNIKMLN